MKPALIVVDMQHDFVHGSLAVPDAVSIIDPINHLLTLPFSIKLATRDWHPHDHISFAQTHHMPVFSKITLHHPISPPDGAEKKSLVQDLWPVHCVAHSPGADFVHGFNHNAVQDIVHKGEDPAIDSYSGFRDAWQLHDTRLPAILQRAAITDVFVVGLAGDYCVKWTALDAVDFGYKTWVVRDAVKSVFPAGNEWNEMTQKGIRITDIKEVESLIK